MTQEGKGRTLFRSGGSSWRSDSMTSAASAPGALQALQTSASKCMISGVPSDVDEVAQSSGGSSLQSDAEGFDDSGSSLNDSSDEFDGIIDKLERATPSASPKCLHRSQSWDNNASNGREKEGDYEFMQSLNKDPGYNKIATINTIEEKPEAETSAPSSTCDDHAALKAFSPDSPVYQRPRLSCMQTPRSSERSRSWSSTQLDKREQIYVEIPASKRQKPGRPEGVLSKSSCPAIVSFPPDTTPNAIRRERLQSKLETTKDVVKQIVAPLTKLSGVRLEAKGDKSDVSTKDLSGDVANDSDSERRTLYERIPPSGLAAQVLNELMPGDLGKIAWIEDSDEDEIASQLAKSPMSARSLSVAPSVSVISGTLSPPAPALPTSGPWLANLSDLAASTASSDSEPPYMSAKDVSLSMDAEIADTSQTMIRLTTVHPDFPSVPVDVTISVDPRTPAGRAAISRLQNVVLLSLKVTKALR